MWLGLYHTWKISPKVIHILLSSWDGGTVSSLDICTKMIHTLLSLWGGGIASSLELCPKVIGVDHPIIGSCALQVMLLLMMMLLIKRSTIVADDRVLQGDEYKSVSPKDQMFECYRRWKMKTRCCRRWCSSTEDVEEVPLIDDCWKLSMTYRCITLMLVNMLSLLAPIVDDVVVSRIPFSLRGSVEIL